MKYNLHKKSRILLWGAMLMVLSNTLIAQDKESRISNTPITHQPYDSNPLRLLDIDYRTKYREDYVYGGSYSISSPSTRKTATFCSQHTATTACVCDGNVLGYDTTICQQQEER